MKLDFFLSLIKEESWFGDVMMMVRDLRSKGMSITDVYLIENKPPLFGILKNFFSVPPSMLKPALPSKAEIRRLITILLRERLTEIGLEPMEAAKKASFIVQNDNFKSFSVVVEQLGILRFLYSKSKEGDTITVRLLPFLIPRIEEVGLPEAYVGYINSFLEESVRLKMPNGLELPINRLKRSGLIVHVGATGSGKTTSISAQVQYFASRMSGMIMTYEDPVEYHYIGYPQVVQYEIGSNIEEKDIYHHFLRASAQIAVFGETRTKEQFMQVVDIANRGHLVYTTLHAERAVDALLMMREFTGRENVGMLVNSIVAIICQRLSFDNRGKITPKYEIIMFNEEKSPESVKQIKKMVEDSQPQELKNYFIDNKDRLRTREVYINQFE